METKSIHVPFVVKDLTCEHGSVYNYFPRGAEWRVVFSRTSGPCKKTLLFDHEYYYTDEKVQEDYNYFTSHWHDYDVFEEAM